jgi:lysine-specific demethylase/histidyl-hydroxylase NO66
MSVLPFLVDDPGDLARCWERAPLLATGPKSFDEFFSVRDLDRLLDEGALPLSSVRLFRDGLPLRGDLVARRRERGNGVAGPIADAAQVAAQVAAGATLVVEELQTYLPGVAAFARQLSAETGAGTYCAAFVTPPGVRGVAAHFDVVSVFIRQVLGTKRWLIREPEQRWPIRESALTGRATEPVLDVELHAGQCLYIPRGYVHAGETAHEGSVHLSIGLKPVTWAATLHRLIDAAASADERLRESLPYAFPSADHEELTRMLRERVELLGASAVGASGSAALAALRPRRGPVPPPPGGRLTEVLTRPKERP